MANSDHVKWLLEGVECWNKRREETHFVPNLADVNIYEEFEKAGQLDHGYIPLSGIDLRKAILRDARLGPVHTPRGADLTHL